MSLIIVFIGVFEFRSLFLLVTVVFIVFYGFVGELWSRNMVFFDWSGYSSNGRFGGEIRGIEFRWFIVLK